MIGMKKQSPYHFHLSMLTLVMFFHLCSALIFVHISTIGDRQLFASHQCEICSALAAFFQFFLQSYQTRFTLANRNSSSEKSKKLSSRQLLLSAGTVCYATCAGSLPQIMIYNLGVSSEVIKAVLRTMLPIPLSAAVAFISVYTVRSEESQTGIKVFDSNGNLVGLSKAAGQKAVKETALSRAALFGTTAAVPSLLITLLWRTRVIQKSSVLIAPLRYMSVAIGFGLMIPVSFSLFPQLGTIKKENVEKNLQKAACDGLLYYHRGL
ncbi:sideroflexin-4 isoform X2 [Gymnodraco acuticeps]|uniref:Sideroflexin-4 isoform X2 n=1 Tax=Gymnodraco acuticeps TaxID=8218 RepID=A0A6P8W1D6_GYMAC|nr:sideroflexin-4 isoform X2 [Gymnodraco acuticeps]